MSYRGRLIFPFLAELFRLDTLATSEDPDDTGPLTSGYDPDFRETAIVASEGSQIGESARKEKAPIRLQCQVEPGTFEALAMFMAGLAPTSQMGLVFHFADLEILGLVDPGGNALIRIGDRLSAIYDIGGSLVQAIRNPPGLFVTEARPIGFGLDLAAPKRNLLLVSLGQRSQGVV